MNQIILNILIRKVKRGEIAVQDIKIEVYRAAVEKSVECSVVGSESDTFEKV